MRFILVFLIFISLNAQSFDEILLDYQTKSDMFFPAKIKQICLDKKDEKAALACYMICILNVKHSQEYIKTALNLSQEKCKANQKFWCEINSLIKNDKDKGIEILVPNLELKPHKNAISLHSLTENEKENLKNLILALSLDNIKKVNCLSENSVTVLTNFLKYNSDKSRNFIKKFARTNSDNPNEILKNIAKNFNQTQKTNFKTKLNQTQNTLIKLDLIFYYSLYKNNFLVASECF